MKLISITGSLLAAASLLVASPANADLIFNGSFSAAGGGNVDYNADTDRGELTCTNCEGVLSDLPSQLNMDPSILNATTASGLSNTDADLFVLANSGIATETAFINAVLAELGIAESFVTGTQIQAADLGDPFFTDAEWFLVKIGTDPDYAVIRNTAGGLNEFSYDGFEGQGAGLSHITVFGGTTTVSEPSIVALFGVGLVLLGFMRRRTIV